MTLLHRPVTPGNKRVKRMCIKLIFILLGRAFQSASRKDPAIRNEILSWEEGFSIAMTVLPRGPFLHLEKKQDRLVFKWFSSEKQDLEICFRNVESAFMVLTPQMGAAQAFAEKRIRVRGDLGLCMSFTRALNELLAVLYPRFVVKRLVKRVPVLDGKKIGLRIWLYTLGIVTGL